MTCKLSQDLMDAYIDGELDLMRSLEIEQHFKECSSCTHAYDQRRSFVTAVKAAPLAFAVPAGLEQDLRTKLQRLSEEDRATPIEPKRTREWDWRSWFFGALMSAGAMALVSLTVLPQLNRPSLDNRLSQDIVEAHVRSLMADHLIDIQTSNQHVVKPWFNGRLDFSPVVKDFSDHGFPLAGGRLEYIAGHPAAAIVYHRALHPINLFIWPSETTQPVPTKTFARQGYHLLRWSEKGMTYWIISDLNPNELNDFADDVKVAAHS